MGFINLTNHEITVTTKKGLITIPASGKVARVVEEIDQNPITFEGCTLFKQVIKNFDDSEFPVVKDAEGNYMVYYIVSAIVKNTTKRDDFIVPSNLVFKSEGDVIGCRNFVY